VNAFEPVVLISDETALGTDLAIQRTLETLCVNVYRLYLGGVMQNAVDVLSGKIPDSEWVILSSHGLGRTDKPDEPPEEMEMGFHIAGREFVLTPQNICRQVRLPGRKIIAQGCGNGREPFGRAFLDAGCSVYIGANASVDQTSSVLFTSLFFYHLLKPNGTPIPPHGKPARIFTEQQAFERARSVDDETGLFRYYTRAEYGFASIR